MVNNYPTVRLVFDRKHLASTTRKGIVEIEICFQRKRKWISTSVQVFSNNWSPEEKVFGLTEALDLNLRIESRFNPIQTYIRRLQLDGKTFTWEALDEFLKADKLDGSFLKFVEERIEKRRDIKDSTKRNHRKLVKALKTFKKINLFSDLTTRRICEFEEWLRGRKDYKQSTIASYHKFMKIYVHEALTKNLIDKNPYMGLSIDRGQQGIRKYLTKTEMVAIEKVELPTASLNNIKDLFLFQCYTGIAYADLAAFDFSKVIKRGDKFLLNDVRRKSGEMYYLVLLPKVMKILEKHNYVLPVPTNQQYNLRLKLIAHYAGLEKPLTTHMARHTYASMCLNAGIKIEVLAQMMGHTDIKTTQIYAKMFNTTVEDAFDQLERNLQQQENERNSKK
ncbi:MAG: site-specific integrase [Muribaculaceae bacterium]|nr:site-specific integrase [Muribaculaceae bacterium]